MRLARALAGMVLLGAVLAGCGSSGTSGTELRRAITSLRTALEAYDRAAQTDIVTTGDACRRAQAAMAGNTVLLEPASGSDALDTPLKNAYTDALAGFADCAAGAPYDYQRMLRAQEEIDRANTWLAQARAIR